MTLSIMTNSRPYHLHDALGYQLTVTARRIERRFEAALKTIQLTRITWCILLAVGDAGHRHPSEIAGFVGIDRTATSRALRQMEAAGLVIRDTGQTDRRNTRVSLTEAGVAKLAQAVPMAQANRDANEARLTGDELTALHSVLEKLRGGDDAPLTRL